MRDAPPRYSRWPRWLAGIAAALAGLALLLALLTETQAGRDQLVRLLPLVKTETGLGVRVARIEGSPWRQAQISGLALTDRQGVFLEADSIALDWRPLRFLSARTLDIQSVASPEVRLLRRPDLGPSSSDRLLPDYDIALGALRIERLVLAPAVAGREQLLALAGDAQVRTGRLKLTLAVDALAAGSATRDGGGDRLRLTLDAEPDRDRLELAASLDAPEGGALLALVGLETPLTLRLVGDGGWQRWAGRLDASSGETVIAGLDLAARDGRFAAAGTLAPAALLEGVAARAVAPALRLEAEAGLGGEAQDLTLTLEGEVLSLGFRARLEPQEMIRDGQLTVQLARPEALYPQASGREVRLAAKLAGRLADPILDWTLSAAALGWGDTGIEALRAAGIVHPLRREDGAVALPFTLAAARVTGVGETAGPLLRDVKADGRLAIGGQAILADGLRLRTSAATATVGLAVPLDGRPWMVKADARVPGYAVPGLGRGDLGAAVTVRPQGDGAEVSGTARLQMTALVSESLGSALGGLPLLETAVRIGPDLAVRLTGARLAAPGLSLRGDLALAASGGLSGRVTGVARDYGPLDLQLAGTTNAPRARLALASPGLGIGLADMVAEIGRTGAEWAVTLEARSSLGPLALAGAARIDDGPLGLRLDRASALGVTGRGEARATPEGPFVGRFVLTGEGLDGQIVLGSAGAVQTADARLAMREARLALETPVVVDRGSLNAGLRFPPGGTDIDARLRLEGLSRGESSIEDVDAELKLASGRGRAKLHASGRTGVPFEVDSVVGIDGDRFEVSADGRLDRQRVRLLAPARILHDGKDWVLEPARLEAGAGQAEISGRTGRDGRLGARLEALPLSLIAAVWPELDFGGTASGRIDLRLPTSGTPRGSIDMRVAGLTRSGASASSLPINLGLRAELGTGGTVARAVITRGGRTEGRAQARIEALTGDGPLLERLYAAGLSGEVRYDGPAQAIWGLSGNDAVLAYGPVKLGARLAGTVGDPRLSGEVRLRDGRVEATLLGTVIEKAELDGRFEGTGLKLERFAGTAGRDGRVSGQGTVDLSAARGFPIDIRLDMQNALLLNRDDFSGSGSGSLRIATDEYGGVVSGRLNVDRANFRIGKRSAEVAVLNVTERNVRALGRRRVVYLPPTKWLLNVDVKGDRRLFVSGLGIDSEWQADLRVRGGAYTPELFGRVELVRGDYDFAGRRFQLTRGDLRFQGGYPPDPLIELAAESTNTGFTAQLAVNGTSSKPIIRFSSVPALPEDEVLSRLLFGESVTNLSAPEAVQLAGALASLRGGGNGFNPVGAVQRGIGIDRLRILPADQQTGRGTSVAAGQYIGRDVYVELATDAQGYTATNIEVSITRSLSILSQVATLGGVGGGLRWRKDY